MEKETFKYTEEENLLKEVLGVLLRELPDNSWEGDNIIIFKKSKEEIGRIDLDDKKISITGETINSEYQKIKGLYEEAVNKPLTLKEYEKTPLEKCITAKRELGGIIQNRKVLKLLNDSFSKLGIKNIRIKESVKVGDTISNDLVLHIECSPEEDQKEIEDGYYSRLRTFLFDNYELPFEKKDNLTMANSNMFRPLPKEKVEDILIDGMLVGKYYSERNYIMIFFNPFVMNPTGIFDDEIGVLWIEVLEALSNLGIKIHNTDKLRERIFISAFMKKSKDKLKSVESEIKSYQDSIAEYERNVANYFLELNSKTQEKAYIEKMLESNGTGVFSEIERVKELPFVEEVNINADSVNIKFKPTVVPISNLKRNLDKGFGKRYAYTGSITYTISPEGFKIDGDARMKGENNGHTHPHGSSGSHSSPCMGDGDGKRKIYELLSSNKFYDLAKMLWFWIKTYREEGAYVKGAAWYDDRLQCGYPVFDEKGNRITINDKERISSGEQIRLTKLPCYEDNLEKFKDFKMEE